MKRVASLYLPNLPTDRLRRIDGKRSSGTSPEAPLVTFHRLGQRMAIAAACPRAMTLGLQPGMALAQARALLPELDARPAEPDADSAVLTHLALFTTIAWIAIGAGVLLFLLSWPLQKWMHGVK